MEKKFKQTNKSSRKSKKHYEATENQKQAADTADARQKSIIQNHSYTKRNMGKASTYYD